MHMYFYFKEDVHTEIKVQTLSLNKLRNITDHWQEAI